MLFFPGDASMWCYFFALIFPFFLLSSYSSHFAGVTTPENQTLHYFRRGDAKIPYMQEECGENRYLILPRGYGEHERRMMLLVDTDGEIIARRNPDGTEIV